MRLYRPCVGTKGDQKRNEVIKNQNNKLKVYWITDL
jgi:hypothetical protein